MATPSLSFDSDAPPLKSVQWLITPVSLMTSQFISYNDRSSCYNGAISPDVLSITRYVTFLMGVHYTRPYWCEKVETTRSTAQNPLRKKPGEECSPRATHSLPGNMYIYMLVCYTYICTYIHTASIKNINEHIPTYVHFLQCPYACIYTSLLVYICAYVAFLHYPR